MKSLNLFEQVLFILALLLGLLAMMIENEVHLFSLLFQKHPLPFSSNDLTKVQWKDRLIWVLSFSTSFDFNNKQLITHCTHKMGSKGQVSLNLILQWVGILLHIFKIVRQF